MVSLSVLALILAVIAVVLSVCTLVVAVDTRARVLADEPRTRVERQDAEAATGAATRDDRRISPTTLSSKQPISGGLSRVPETPPTAIAPGLQKPPRPKGGFGSQPNAPQLSPDDKASREED